MRCLSITKSCQLGSVHYRTANFVPIKQTLPAPLARKDDLYLFAPYGQRFYLFERSTIEPALNLRRLRGRVMTRFTRR
jgi:hypothetical protein